MGCVSIQAYTYNGPGPFLHHERRQRNRLSCHIVNVCIAAVVVVLVLGLDQAAATGKLLLKLGEPVGILLLEREYQIV